MNKTQEKLANYADIPIKIKQISHFSSVAVKTTIDSTKELVPKAPHDNISKFRLHKNTYIDTQKATILNKC